jgi:NTP pyrophosphatase (non-canonical NTP hydrolase)
MTLAEYQEKAARTVNTRLSARETEMHALHGIAGETGEIHSLYQKKYQGHPLEDAHLKKELGDLIWFVAEMCTAKGWDLEEIGRLNIEKLRARYPEGFEAERSLHRRKGDV